MTKAREIAELGQKLTVDGSGNLDIAGTVEANNIQVEGASGSLINVYRASANANFDAITFKDTTNTNNFYFLVYYKRDQTISETNPVTIRIDVETTDVRLATVAWCILEDASGNPI